MASCWQFCVQFDRPEILISDLPIETNLFTFHQLVSILWQNTSKYYNIL